MLHILIFILSIQIRKRKDVLNPVRAACQPCGNLWPSQRPRSLARPLVIKRDQRKLILLYVKYQHYEPVSMTSFKGISVISGTCISNVNLFIVRLAYFEKTIFLNARAYRVF